MKALVIGGTTGFGSEVTKGFEARNYEVIRVGRTVGTTDQFNYACDVSNTDQWRDTLTQIKRDHETIEAVACIVGYARLKPSAELTDDDWELARQLNLGYVEMTYSELQDNLRNSGHPMLLTTGSQWSYREGNDLLVPYIDAKHKLREWTENLAQSEQQLKANHICVPTMATPQYEEIVQADAELSSSIRSVELADYRRIASVMVPFFLDSEESGKTYIIDKEGKVYHIDREDKIERINTEIERYREQEGRHVI